MSAARRWFGGQSRDRFTLEYLQNVCAHLVKYKEVTEYNQEGLIEILREIAELMIWGDKHNPAFFDFFLEKNILSYFLHILSQEGNDGIKIQLIQTLSIMLQNINSDTSVYYLLSNNHINDLIGHKFDFSTDQNEELLAYYISFLKTLSLKLNRSTLHFYFNERAQNFPLYTEAIKFFNHKESMVRIAARTLTLNVYRVEDPAMRKFILDEERAPYFSRLAVYVRDQYLYLDSLVAKSTYFDHTKLDEVLSEQIDLLYYLEDIFGLGIPELSDVLTHNLLNHFLFPILVESLKPTLPGDQQEGRISPLLALFVLAQVFKVFDHVPLINGLAREIFLGSATSTAAKTTASGFARVGSVCDGKAKEKEKKLGKDRRLPEHRYEFRDTFFGYLLQGDERLVLATLSLFLAVFKNQSVDKDILEAADLLPAKHRNARQLMAALTMSDAGSSHFSDESPRTQDAVHITPPGEGGSDRQGDDDDYDGEAPDHISQDEQLGSIRPHSPSDVVTHSRSGASESESDSASCFPSSKERGNSRGKNDKEKEEYPAQLVNLVLFILERNPPLRLITVQVAINLATELAFRNSKCLLGGEHIQIVADAYEFTADQMRTRITGQLGDRFVDLVEGEDREIRPREVRLESIITDPIFLLPVTTNPLSGIPLARRLPCGEMENTRRLIQMFLALRQFRLQIAGKTEDRLPIQRAQQPAVREGEFVELTHRDVIGCAIFVNNRRQVRYLAPDNMLLILVEPDQTRIGWAIVRLSEPLLNVELNIDKGDKRMLHVTVPRGNTRPSQEQYGAQGGIRIQETLAFTLFFDDPMHCTAAKHYMDNNRARLRQDNILQLSALLGTDF